MPKKARLNPEIERCIVELVANDPSLGSKQIDTELKKRFDGTGIRVPAQRTIQDRAKQVRDLLTYQEKPWSLAIMTKQRPDVEDDPIGIPWEACNYIINAILDMKERISRKKEKPEALWPYTHSFLKSIDRLIPSSNEVFSCQALTIRQAKWLWRLHLILPEYKLKDLFFYADAYAARELYSHYLSWKFDTADLDTGLMTKRMHTNVHGHHLDRDKPEKTKGDK